MLIILLDAHDKWKKMALKLTIMPMAMLHWINWNSL